MEVHPPHGPIHSVKEFMVHLLAITIGLLIALGLESTVEWIHHRHQVAEARHNIAQEIHENQANLGIEMGALPEEQKQIEDLLSAINDEEHGGAAKTNRNMVWKVTRLTDASWNTAFSTGAVAHMDYGEVRDYSLVYGLQQMFNNGMEHYIESRRDMYAFLTRFDLPGKLSASEFEDGKRVLSQQLITSKFLFEIGQALNHLYAKQPQPN